MAKIRKYLEQHTHLKEYEKLVEFFSAGKETNIKARCDTSSVNIEVGNGPHGIRASKDSQWLYVTLTKENTVAVINLQSMKIEKKIPASRSGKEKTYR